MDLAAQLNAIKETTITELVRRTVRSDTADVVDWKHQAIHSGGGASTGGIFRFFGSGVDRGTSISWSLILKALCAPDIVGGPSDWGLWNREALAYGSDALDDLPGGIAAPRCLGITEFVSEGTWLWLEDLGDELRSPWPLVVWRSTARRLGHFNGAYLAGRHLPAYQWLSKEWLITLIMTKSSITVYINNNIFMKCLSPFCSTSKSEKNK
jgi:hypothetical protein